MKTTPLNFVAVFLCLLALARAEISATADPQPSASFLQPSDPTSSNNRQMVKPMLMPFYAPAAVNQQLLGGMQFGAAPYAFTPYSMYHMNPFMNPSFAMQMPFALQHHPFGKQMLNYMTFMNPLMFSPLGFGDTWDMGEFGMGTPKAVANGNLTASRAHRKMSLKKAAEKNYEIEPQPLKMAVTVESEDNHSG